MGYRDLEIYLNSLNATNRQLMAWDEMQRRDKELEQQQTLKQVQAATELFRAAKNPDTRIAVGVNIVAPAVRKLFPDMPQDQFDLVSKAFANPDNKSVGKYMDYVRTGLEDMNKGLIKPEELWSNVGLRHAELAETEMSPEQFKAVGDARDETKRQIGLYAARPTRNLGFNEYGSYALLEQTPGQLPTRQASKEEQAFGLMAMGQGDDAAKLLNPQLEKEKDTATADLRRFELVTGTDPATRGTPQYLQDYMKFMRESKQNVTIHSTPPRDLEKESQNREEFVLKIGREARVKAAQETKLKFGKTAIEIDADGNIISSNADQKAIDYYQSRFEKHNSMMTNQAVKRGALSKNYEVPKPVEPPERKVANTSQKQVLEQAKDAVKKGAPAQEVAKRLQQFGYTQQQLTSDPYFKGWLY